MERTNDYASVKEFIPKNKRPIGEQPNYGAYDYYGSQYNYESNANYHFNPRVYQPRIQTQPPKKQEQKPLPQDFEDDMFFEESYQSSQRGKTSRDRGNKTNQRGRGNQRGNQRGNRTNNQQGREADYSYEKQGKQSNYSQKNSKYTQETDYYYEKPAKQGNNSQKGSSHYNQKVDYNTQKQGKQGNYNQKKNNQYYKETDNYYEKPGKQGNYNQKKNNQYDSYDKQPRKNNKGKQRNDKQDWKNKKQGNKSNWNQDEKATEFTEIETNYGDFNTERLVFKDNQCFTHLVDYKIDRRTNFPKDNNLRILMVAEKPSIAKSIASALSNSPKTVSSGKGQVILEFNGKFGGNSASFTVSSVLGHVYSTDFEERHNKWDSIDELSLFDVPIQKSQANPKTRVPAMMSRLAKGKDIIMLWLDCDREGENICYEVLFDCYPVMTPRNYQQIFRAKFSSITKPDIQKAFNDLQNYPNSNESASVDLRQVLDLKIGVAFTRFLTTNVLKAFPEIDSNLLSYGPCQTPTLWFCLERQKEIDRFVPKEYYKLYIDVNLGVSTQTLYFRERIWSEEEARVEVAKVSNATCNLIKLSKRDIPNTPPIGLNTVKMLQVASSFLKIGPKMTMNIAENLYTKGYISYPRTETTKYASSFNFSGLISEFSKCETFGQRVSALSGNYLKNNRGTDSGDHPPITPVRLAKRSDLKGNDLRIYDMIVGNFFASISKPAVYEETKYVFKVNETKFEKTEQRLKSKGYIAFQPHKSSEDAKRLSGLKEGDEFAVSKCGAGLHYTEPPSLLSESELLKLMDENKIGTDASMSVHIENICARKYVEVDSNRHLVPTTLGKSVIGAISLIDPDLVAPQVRARIEGDVDLVGKGKKSYGEVLQHSLKVYKDKFLKITRKYKDIIAYFKRYFKLDAAYYSKRTRELNQGVMNACKDTILKKRDPRSVTTGIGKCDCGGMLYVDFNELEKYVLPCTKCDKKKKLPRDLVQVKVLQEKKCTECDVFMVWVELENPFLSGETEYTGCLLCDDELN